jgi:alpha-beta hydrolase superfamily lysophospholipase
MELCRRSARGQQHVVVVTLLLRLTRPTSLRMVSSGAIGSCLQPRRAIDHTGGAQVQAVQAVHQQVDEVGSCIRFLGAWSMRALDAQHVDRRGHGPVAGRVCQVGQDFASR